MLALALVLDAIFGEPDWLWSRLPHPAVLMGRAVGALDRWLNRGAGRRAKGVGAVALLVGGAWALGWGLAAIPDGGVIEVGLAAILLAQRSLLEHVRAVAHALRRGVPEGRAAVAMIVGRDTEGMTAPQIARAAIESAAENLSDGVVAPAVWFAVAGLPGMLVYKAVNTADSMIGYRTPRHEAFGWAAARLDDALNWIPARLTAGLILLVHGAWRHAPQVPRDARLHRSPNAGWPEAALAPVLGIALAGPRSYAGRLQEFPWVNAAGRRDPGPDEIERACAALWRCWAGLFAIAAGLALLSQT
ncbi:adenosylcobinamide-phosphate synthase CbiB [Jannaschia seohaensis]|uniref:Cobalamin biosynthesis protein CobD n=1 Tax=Jannaschia seohaensis TaxID=475081 RepID=A0A2Y9C406_9RHOB|nr:adenosylcobinamide-phosphate synthase CbiB [Jannaschia seohaensis]PWJ22465.1 adenosylcobinamide-phosphate synthase [Jannaschia seohaensis]SSA38743.1 adenosylcobinamide-phosphate synthase [Jannaschia seohaensis]